MQRFNRTYVYFFAVIMSVGLSACTEDKLQARGFVLPAGDAAAGKADFIALQCQQCHKVAGVELPADKTMRDGPVIVRLGGSSSKVKTYGDLVTSIINPSHKLLRDAGMVSTPDGKSMMTVYNEIMTVQQLIDIVAFLQPRYQLVVPVNPMP